MLSWKVSVDPIPLHAIADGEVGLKCSFSIGPIPVPESGLAVEFAGVVGEDQRPPSFPPGSVVCVYLLYYGSWVKIGTSSPQNVVARMISQVPFLGVVVAVIELREDVEYRSESIENFAIEMARKDGFEQLKKARPRLEWLVDLWQRPSRKLLELLEEVERKRNPLLVEEVRKTAKVALRSALLHGRLLYGPGLFWFSTYRSLGDSQMPSLDEKMIRNLREGQEVCIKPYPNGMLGIKADWPQKALTAGSVEYVCTSHQLRTALFRVRE